VSHWLAQHGWKPGLVLLAVSVFLSPSNPVIYAVCFVGALVCCWWGLAVRTKRGFVEGYRGDGPGGSEETRRRD
jgi:hypothetical protein